MKPLTLFPHEITRLLAAGSALLVRPIPLSEPVKYIAGDVLGQPQWYLDGDSDRMLTCPHGAPGDTRWCRETWQIGYVSGTEYGGWPYEADLHEGPVGSKPLPMAPDPWRSEGYYLGYRADGDDDGPWRSPVTMPRWASRLSVVVQDVTVKRVGELTEDDLKALGRGFGYGHYEFAVDWDARYGKQYLYADNQWVWAINVQQAA